MQQLQVMVIFWFTFFHELGHILLHGSKDKFLEYEGDVKDKKEGEADRFAREILIPSSSLKEFLEDKPLNAEKIKNFANLMMVDSGIVLGIPSGRWRRTRRSSGRDSRHPSANQARG